MRRQSLVLALAALTASCAPATSGRFTFAEPADLRWVEGPSPEVRTLLLEPVRVARVTAPGHAEADLEIGAFFARYQRGDGPLDQLALMVRVEGADAEALLAQSRQLLLEVDGELFAGEPGLTGNTFRVEQLDEGCRAVLVIPVSPADLARLAGANDVKGRLGLWASFGFPAEARDRLAGLLDRLPPGAPVGLGDRPLLTRLALGSLD